jgi:Integrase core domain
LRARLRELAGERPRFGYRRPYIFLRREKTEDGTLRWRVKPTQNAFIESFNGKFRHECLNQNWFVDLRHAREVIEDWQVDDNTVRPHRSRGYRTPEEFAAVVAARPASPPTPVVSIDPAWAGSDVQEPRSANL